jgi:hypothetical protein
MNNVFVGVLRWRVLFLLVVLFAVFFTSITLFQAHASSCSAWEHCPITQRYGQNQEHGVDLLTEGLPITALLSGTITFSHEECWDGECVMDITWQLDHPNQAGGSPYMYVQIRTSNVYVGEHVAAGALLGYSGSFIEVGLTPDWAYGVSNWRWGVNILAVFPWLGT